MIARRGVVLGLVGGALALGLGARAGEFDPARDAGFDAWKSGFARRARAAGIARGVVDQGLAQAEFLPGVIAKDRSQFEFSLSFEDYLAITNSPERVARGGPAVARVRPVARAYGIEAPALAALWGIESFYGSKRGEVPVLSSQATLAYEGRRREFFEGQLLAALRILQRGDVAAGRMLGGWAGAMGHTQVIPTTYLEFSQDVQGDGRADIWGDDPTDALATAAHYLNRSGWRAGAPWGQEVLLPPSFGTKAVKQKSRPLADWTAAGLRPASGDFRSTAKAALIRPQAGGPAFLTWGNYQVFKRYNGADSYALAMGLLSDRLSGLPPLVAGFPPDRYGLTQADRIALQQGLTRRGFDCGSVDGVFGPKTTAAIKGWQRQMGMAVDGVPTKAMVAAVR